jgi:UDP-N-acetylglucosamine 4-epimerase
VIPLFAEAVLSGNAPTINGDGKHSRDFTYVENAVQANILSLFTEDPAAVNQVYNIACGHQTSLNELFASLKRAGNSTLEPIYGPERKGDVKHSLADISKAKKLLGYNPAVSVEEGLARTFQWYQNNRS